jgi:hypothetical protein
MGLYIETLSLPGDLAAISSSEKETVRIVLMAAT